MVFFPKYEKSSVIPADMCNKPCLGPIIIWSTKWMTRFRFYPSSYTEQHQIMKLHEFNMNQSYYGGIIMGSCAIGIMISISKLF